MISRCWVFLIFILVWNLSFANCIAKRRYVDIPDDSAFFYARVHPSGNYLLVSGDEGGVKIFDLRSDPARVISTPMNGETYPVQGSWTLLASPGHSEGMSYFRFEDVLDKGMAARAVFSDSDHDELYHSSAELPGSNPSELKIRTMLYTDNQIRDYTFRPDRSGTSRLEKGESGRVCSNGIVGVPSAPPGEYEKLVTARAEAQAAMKKYLEIRKGSPHAGESREAFEVRKASAFEEFRRLIKLRGRLEEEVAFKVHQPTISPNGFEFGGLYQGTSRIYSINSDGTCTLKKNFGYKTSKMTFSNSPPGRGQVGFIAGGQIKLYDRDRDILTTLSESTEGISDSVSYPGFTDDGRVIYIANINRDAKVAIVDPNQVDPRLGSCIQGSGGEADWRDDSGI